MNSASGVLLKLDRPLLVTAEHVVESFLKRQADEPSLELQVARGSIHNVYERVIGKTKQPDLAVLDLTGLDLHNFAEHLDFYRPSKWPPSPVIPTLSALLVGFPMKYRGVLPDQRTIKFESLNVHTQVTSVSNHGFVCAIDAQQMHHPSPHAVWPQTYGGISGCPVFAIRGTLISTLELVGIVYEANDNWNIVRAHHAKLISTEGSLCTTSSII